ALPPQMLVGSAPTPRSLTTPPTSATLPPPCPRSPAATPPATVKLSPGRRAARSRPRSVHRGYPTSPPPFPRCETRHVKSQVSRSLRRVHYFGVHPRHLPSRVSLVCPASGLGTRTLAAIIHGGHSRNRDAHDTD